MDIVEREVRNHEYDNCNYHRDEFFCDCSFCSGCRINLPPDLFFNDGDKFCKDCIEKGADREESAPLSPEIANLSGYSIVKLSYFHRIKQVKGE